VSPGPPSPRRDGGFGRCWGGVHTQFTDAPSKGITTSEPSQSFAARHCFETAAPARSTWASAGVLLDQIDDSGKAPLAGEAMDRRKESLKPFKPFLALDVEQGAFVALPCLMPSR